MQVVKSMHAAAVDVFAHTLPITGSFDAMVTDCRIADVSDHECHILGALKRSEVMAVCKHASRSEVASTSEVTIGCE
jgi:hypothetical protein